MSTTSPALSHLLTFKCLLLAQLPEMSQCLHGFDSDVFPEPVWEQSRGNPSHLLSHYHTPPRMAVALPAGSEGRFHSDVAVSQRREGRWGWPVWAPAVRGACLWAVRGAGLCWRCVPGPDQWPRHHTAPKGGPTSFPGAAHHLCSTCKATDVIYLIQNPSCMHLQTKTTS